MSNYKVRLYEEHASLQDHIKKLKVFILSKEFDRLSEVERIDLKDQLVYMEQYFRILNMRIARLCT